MKLFPTSFNIRNLIPQNPKTKHNVMVVFLITLSLVGFIFIYNNFFKPKVIPLDVVAPESVSGKKITSTKVSEALINKIKKDIKRMQEELNNSFYSNLREYKPSGEVIVKPGRDNPFTL